MRCVGRDRHDLQQQQGIMMQLHAAHAREGMLQMRAPRLGTTNTHVNWSRRFLILILQASGLVSNCVCSQATAEALGFGCIHGYICCV